jgi:hypothetical protein
MGGVLNKFALHVQWTNVQVQNNEAPFTATLYVRILNLLSEVSL